MSNPKKTIKDIEAIVDASSAGKLEEKKYDKPLEMFIPPISVIDNLTDTDKQKLENLIRKIVQEEIMYFSRQRE